jgi:hypothetical protein
MNASFCPSQFDWGIPDNDHSAQAPTEHSLALRRSVDRIGKVEVQSTARHQRMRRQNLETREIATCDISDIVRQLYAKRMWGENEFPLEWNTYKEVAPITIDEDCYTILDLISRRIASPPVKLLDATQTTAGSFQSNFNRLVSTWKQETAGCSITARRYAHSSYQEILVMGKPVIPLILRELQERPDWWFEALKALTNQDPTKPTDNFRDAVKSWLKWGRDHKLI